MKLSIIVPVYKVEHYLSRCLDSIIGQTFGDFEAILIDDGSPDGSGSICDEYAARDSRLKVIHQKNGGLAAARNVGVAASRGEYIGFVDSDDWIDLPMYEKLLATAEKHSADIVKSGFDFTDGKSSHDYNLFDKPLEVVEENILDHYYLGAKGTVVWNGIYKAKIAKSVKYPEGFTHEDLYGSFLYYALAKRAVFLRDCYYHYFDNHEGISSSSRSGKRGYDSDNFFVRKKLYLLEKEQGLHLSPHDREQLHSFYARAVYHHVRDSQEIREIHRNDYDTALKNLDFRRKLAFWWAVRRQNIKITD